MFRVLSYRIRADIDPNRPREERVRAQVTVHAVSEADSLDQAVLYLYEEFTVDGAAVSGGGTWHRDQALRHPQGFEGSALIVTFDRPLARGEEFTVDVSYHGGMSKIVWNYCMVKWYLVELMDFSCWYPLAGRESLFTFDLHLTLPSEMVVVTNGDLISSHVEDGGSRTTWRSSTPVEDVVVLASPKFRSVKEDAAGCRGALYYMCMGDAQAAAILDASMGAVAYFTEALGVSPEASDLVWVFSPRFGEGGYTRGKLATMSEPWEMLEFNHPSPGNKPGVFYGIGHEIAHFWWGHNHVRADSSTYHGWIIEALANFYAFEYDRARLGDDMTRFYLQFEKNVNALEGNRVLASTAFSTQNRFVLWYQKGSWVLRMLQDYLGEEEYGDAMRRFYRSHQGAVVTTIDLQRCLEASGGRPLNWFFDQWIGRPDLPAPEFLVQKEAQSLRVQVRQSKAPPFRFDLGVSVMAADGRQVRIKFAVGQAEVERVVDVGGLQGTLRVRFDPEVKLLMESTSRDACEVTVV